MKPSTVLVITIASVGLLILGFFSLPNSDTTSSQDLIAQKRFETIRDELMNNTAVMYDVRTPEEYSSGKYDKAINLPLQNIQNGKLPEQEKNSKIYLYCRSGNRSAQALELLKQAGYTNVTDLGGLESVKNIGGILR